MHASYIMAKYVNTSLYSAECTVEGQIKMDCGIDKRCAYTCDNSNTSIQCSFPCIARGCQCPDGTVVNKLINKCVKHEECPPSEFPLVWCTHTYNSAIVNPD